MSLKSNGPSPRHERFNAFDRLLALEVIKVQTEEREPGVVRPDGNRRQIERPETPSDLLEGGAVARVASEEEPVLRSQNGPAAPQRLEEHRMNLDLAAPLDARVGRRSASMRCRHLVVVQRRALAPVLRRRADERDVVVAGHAVLLPPVQLDDVLAAHLHQPVHQTQGDEPGEEEERRLIPTQTTTPR